MDSPSTFLIIDGMALVYRAFFAIRNLQTADGRPTNALLGFIHMVQQLQTNWHPTHQLVVFDGGLPESRMKLLPSYKAQRSKMPDELRAQLPYINDFLEVYAMGSLRVDKQEADDVMASLAVRAADDGARVLLATSDKDLFQMVCPSIHMVTHPRDTEPMDEAAVMAKTGVAPGQIVEWLALIGDSADNIPGVPGIGPKTASKLLSDYHDLNRVWDQIDSVLPLRIRNLLLEHRSVVDRNVDMVKLDLEAAGDACWTSYGKDSPNFSRLHEFYTEYELHALAKRIREPELF